MNNSSKAVEENGIIALVNVDGLNYDILLQCDFNGSRLMQFNSGIDLTTQWNRNGLNIIAIISQSEVIAPEGVFLLETLQKSKFPDVPYFLIANKVSENLNKICIQAGVADIFKIPVRKESIATRVNFLIKNWKTMREKARPQKIDVYKVPLPKRLFDLIFSGLAIIMLSPLLLLVVIAMKLESKGPIFYYSLRVGTGYRVFKFFKIRSMYVNADKRLKDLAHLNQYGSRENIPEEVMANLLCDDCIKERDQLPACALCRYKFVVRKKLYQPPQSAQRGGIRKAQK